MWKIMRCKRGEWVFNWRGGGNISPALVGSDLERGVSRAEFNTTHRPPLRLLVGKEVCSASDICSLPFPLFWIKNSLSVALGKVGLSPEAAIPVLPKWSVA